MLPNKLSDRLRLMRWALPAAIALLAVVYQIGLARYVHDHYGEWAHYGMEVFLYATIGLSSCGLCLALYTPGSCRKSRLRLKSIA